MEIFTYLLALHKCNILTRYLYFSFKSPENLFVVGIYGVQKYCSIFNFFMQFCGCISLFIYNIQIDFFLSPCLKPKPKTQHSKLSHISLAISQNAPRPLGSPSGCRSPAATGHLQQPLANYLRTEGLFHGASMPKNLQCAHEACISTKVRLGLKSKCWK